MPEASVCAVANARINCFITFASCFDHVSDYHFNSVLRKNGKPKWKLASKVELNWPATTRSHFHNPLAKNARGLTFMLGVVLIEVFFLENRTSSINDCAVAR